MTIPENYFILINILIILIYLAYMVIAFKNGVIYQLLAFFYMAISLFLAYKFSPVLAERFALLTLDPFLFVDLTPIVNRIFYFVLIFLVLKVLSIIILPLFKKVSDIPLIGWINRLGGFLIGLINATVTVLLLSLLLSTPLCKNGNEVKEKTFLKYISSATDYVTDTLVENVDFSELGEKIDDFSIDEFKEKVKDFISGRNNEE